jgi:hypothetical protein
MKMHILESTLAHRWGAANVDMHAIHVRIRHEDDAHALITSSDDECMAPRADTHFVDVGFYNENGGDQEPVDLHAAIPWTNAADFAGWFNTEAAAYLARNPLRPAIKVGDMVRKREGCQWGTAREVLAICGDWAWILSPGGSRYSKLLTDLEIAPKSCDKCGQTLP